MEPTSQRHGFSTPQGLALAYDHLYAFCDDLGDGPPGVHAIDPDTGEIRWTVQDPPAAATQEPPKVPDLSGAIEHAFVANHVVYFYNTVLEQSRAIDAFSGNLLWSIKQLGIRGLAAAADHSLIVLLENEIKIYQGSHRIHFAHVADGGGQTTLVTLENLSGQTAAGRIDFLSSQGKPFVVGIEDIGTASSVLFSIPPRASKKIQTLGLGPIGSPGWTLVHSDQPLHGSSIVQFTQGGVILLEAGVANPSEQAATAILTLLDETGNFLVDLTLVLKPGHQLPRFIHELFPSEAANDFQGTLVVDCDQPIVTTALRTQNDVQMSSYPVGQRIR